ncbi:MAG: hypothetical protein OXR64_03705 [Chloroflexota bacterium]|nr:hypothetical protein [Chloroflexota bacterium]MDE2918930.1 hypothetical protein [Chloroflexota bacterium]
MPWFPAPQRDSPDEVAAAHQALVYAGYPRREAAAELQTHLSRVRAASASLRDTVLAGFLVGATLAVSLAFVLAITAFVMDVAVGRGVPVITSGGVAVVRGADNGETSDRPATDPEDVGRGLPLDILVSAATIEVLLGVAGAGMALVSRSRWRRAGALETFTDLNPERGAWLPTLAVWVAVGGLMVLAVRIQGGEQLVEGAVIALAFVGIPLLAVVFARAFPSLYRWFLLRVSRLDAAAFVRPIIELESALQIKAERQTYSRSAYHGAAYDQGAWADEVLARLDTSRTARRRR